MVNHANDNIPILSLLYTNISKRCISRVNSECLAVTLILPVLLRATGGEGSEPGHEEVETGEGDHVDR